MPSNRTQKQLNRIEFHDNKDAIAKYLRNRNHYSPMGILKNYRDSLIIFIGVFVLLYLILQLSNRTGSADDVVQGYYQLVENASLPIVLAENKDQFSLHISSLIRGTPVHQVRIYDISENLLFRVQNISNTEGALETISDNLFFESNTIGRLEVDVSGTIVKNSPPALLISFLIALIASVFANLAPKFFSFAPRFNQQTDEGTLQGSPEQSWQAYPSKFAVKNANLILLARVQVQEGANSASDDSLSTQLNRTERVIKEMSDLYDLEIIAVCAETLVFLLNSEIDKNSIHRATMFCWGLTQLFAETQEEGQGHPRIQSYVLSSSDFSIPCEDSLAFWTELEARCACGHSAEAFVSSSLTSRIDTASFETVPTKNGFARLTSTSSSIQKLWQNQRAQNTQK